MYKLVIRLKHALLSLAGLRPADIVCLNFRHVGKMMHLRVTIPRNFCNESIVQSRDVLGKESFRGIWCTVSIAAYQREKQEYIAILSSIISPVLLREYV